MVVNMDHDDNDDDGKIISSRFFGKNKYLKKC